MKKRMLGRFETVKGNLRCEAVFPVWDPTTSNPLHVSDRWKGDSVALVLTKQQANDLAAALKDASEQKGKIIITGFRKGLKNGQIHVTVGGTLPGVKIDPNELDLFD